jgi:hypothetical protein
MDEREAKDFLVQQAASQAALEGISLSNLEKRMMYFSESGYVPEDPIALNDEFEAQYDTDEYEEKISKLLQHAYKRISKDSDTKHRTWNAAIKCLRRGDHYILVMCDVVSAPSTAGPVNWSLYAVAGSAVAIVMAVWVGMRWVTAHFPPPDPRIIWGIIAGVVLCATLFRSQFMKAVGWLIDNTLGQALEKKGRDS